MNEVGSWPCYLTDPTRISRLISVTFDDSIFCKMQMDSNLCVHVPAYRSPLSNGANLVRSLLFRTSLSLSVFLPQLSVISSLPAPALQLFPWIKFSASSYSALTLIILIELTKTLRTPAMRRPRCQLHADCSPEFVWENVSLASFFYSMKFIFIRGKRGGWGDASLLGEGALFLPLSLNCQNSDEDSVTESSRLSNADPSRI